MKIKIFEESVNKTGAVKTFMSIGIKICIISYVILLNKMAWLKCSPHDVNVKTSWGK